MKEKESPFEQQQTQFYRNIKIMKIKYYLLTSLFTCLLLNHCSSAVEEKSAPAAEPSRGYPHSASGVSDSEIARKPAREQNQPAKMPLVVRKKYHNKIERKTHGNISNNKDKLPASPKDEEYNTEQYDKINDNPFLDVKQNPLSTFSIDVDTASYANVRRYLTSGSLPPKDAVRIEELINYFSYNYKEPEGKTPFSVATEISTAPGSLKTT